VQHRVHHGRGHALGALRLPAGSLRRRCLLGGRTLPGDDFYYEA
jgi:hypothetical protein